jgi:hypothetical protein
LVVAFTLAMGGGCFSDQYVTDAPPPAARDAEKWWAQTVEQLPPDFLAVLCEASEVHRQGGTTATYVSSFSGRTMVCWYHYQEQLPLPLPDGALTKASARLAGWSATAAQPSYSTRTGEERRFWEGGEGCSPQKAAEIWQEAEKKCGWSPDQGNTRLGGLGGVPALAKGDDKRGHAE